MRRPSSLVRTLLLLAPLAAAGCGSAPPPEPPASAPVQSVVRRLTGRDFGQTPLALPHRPLVKIGDEGRTVALGPRTRRVVARCGARAAAGTRLHASFPRTDVAHLSLFTGLYPDAQPQPGRLRADATAALMTESLRDAGLFTAGFTVCRRHHVPARQRRAPRFFLFLHTYKTRALGYVQ